MDDLVKRLRFEGDESRYIQNEGADPAICIEAADAVESLLNALQGMIDDLDSCHRLCGDASYEDALAALAKVRGSKPHEVG